MQNVLALSLTQRLGLPAWVRDAGLVAAGSLLVAALSQVSFPLPFTPVPVTGQTFAVLLVGATLGARRGAASLALYVAEGCLGLPVFAGGGFGPARLLGPTGGYLIGFIAAAYVVGYLAERGFGRRLSLSLLTMLAGEAVIFAFGLPWLALFVGVTSVLPAGLWPFLPGAVIKVLLAALALDGSSRLVDGRASERSSGLPSADSAL